MSYVTVTRTSAGFVTAQTGTKTKEVSRSFPILAYRSACKNYDCHMVNNQESHNAWLNQDQIEIGKVLVIKEVPVLNPYSSYKTAIKVQVLGAPIALKSRLLLPVADDAQYEVNFDRFLADPSLHNAKALAATGRKLGRDVSYLQDYINTFRAEAVDLGSKFEGLAASHSKKSGLSGNADNARCRTRRLLAVDRRAARHFAEANA